MPRYPDIPRWPFRSTIDDEALDEFSDFELNQCLSIILGDDELSHELITEFGQRKDDLVVPFSSTYRPPEGEAPCGAWLIAHYEEVKMAVLNGSSHFSNTPYAELGGSSFMLGLDPFADSENTGADQKYLRQRVYLEKILSFPKSEEQYLSRLANMAVRSAVTAGLTDNRFDLAELSEQAAVRFCCFWFGFSSEDHLLIEKVAELGYQALVHVVIGKHFSHNVSATVTAQKGMAKLSERVAELIAEYRKLSWEPRKIRGTLEKRALRERYPEGVTPLKELGLDVGRWGLDENDFPLLRKIALTPCDFTISELAAMVTGMIVGTVGNVQASACVSIRQILGDPRNIDAVLKEARSNPAEVHKGDLHSRIGKLLTQYPPVPFLPRRATASFEIGGQQIKEGDEVVLWLAAASRLKQRQYKSENYGLAFGAPDKKLKSVSADNASAQAHSCTGKPAAHALVTAIVGTVLRLPSVAQVVDPVSGKAEGLTQRFGFACDTYPLTHRRDLRIAQQPLNLYMRVKTPIDFHSEAVQQIIRVGAPRIAKVLKQSSHVHFAWFELLDQGRVLALHTVYDGDFEAYVQDFALKVDDLFDLLLEHIENAPPLPVAENMRAFVETVRANNLPAVNGFFFAAAPTAEAYAVAAKFSDQP